MHGARRVVVFCLLTAVLPTILLIIPLYLRHSVYANVTYAVAESDVLELGEGISTVFCQEQVLKMNSTFHAFQLESMPKVSGIKKHIQLKKSMVLPDDTLEYWGFFLLRDSVITVTACSRYGKARILAVRGEKNLRTCGLMQHTKNPTGLSHPTAGQVQITPKPSAAVSIWPKNEEVPKPMHKPVRHSFQFDDDKNDTNNEQFEGENESDYETDENTSEEDTIKLEERIRTYIDKQLALGNTSSRNESLMEETNITTSLTETKHQIMKQNRPRKVRHAKSRLIGMDRGDEKDDSYKDRKTIKNLLRNRLQQSLIGGTDDRKQKKIKETDYDETRKKRDILDTGIEHGGNAADAAPESEENSASSFERSLTTCYGGDILFTYDIPGSSNCSDVLDVYKQHVYKVLLDGYYYLIFYSDNEPFDSIHARFDIDKTTYEYTNYTNGCINQTECTFPIKFWSDEIVIAEIPTKDGIEHEDSDISYLISSCNPRMSVYVVFPVAVLFLVLGCAFL